MYCEPAVKKIETPTWCFSETKAHVPYLQIQGCEMDLKRIDVVVAKAGRSIDACEEISSFIFLNSRLRNESQESRSSISLKTC